VRTVPAIAIGLDGPAAGPSVRLADFDRIVGRKDQSGGPDGRVDD
jgi:hypothetical protein